MCQEGSVIFLSHDRRSNELDFILSWVDVPWSLHRGRHPVPACTRPVRYPRVAATLSSLCCSLRCTPQGWTAVLQELCGGNKAVYHMSITHATMTLEFFSNLLCFFCYVLLVSSYHPRLETKYDKHDEQHTTRIPDIFLPPRYLMFGNYFSCIVLKKRCSKLCIYRLWKRTNTFNSASFDAWAGLMHFVGICARCS